MKGRFVKAVAGTAAHVVEGELNNNNTPAVGCEGDGDDDGEQCGVFFHPQDDNNVRV